MFSSPRKHGFLTNHSARKVLSMLIAGRNKMNFELQRHASFFIDDIVTPFSVWNQRSRFQGNFSPLVAGFVTLYWRFGLSVTHATTQQQQLNKSTFKIYCSLSRCCIFPSLSIVLILETFFLVFHRKNRIELLRFEFLAAFKFKVIYTQSMRWGSCFYAFNFVSDVSFIVSWQE